MTRFKAMALLTLFPLYLTHASKAVAMDEWFTKTVKEWFGEKSQNAHQPPLLINATESVYEAPYDYSFGGEPSHFFPSNPYATGIVPVYTLPSNQVPVYYRPGIDEPMQQATQRTLKSTHKMSTEASIQKYDVRAPLNGLRF